jgi:uncharacterized protein with PQ loop repeat
VQNAIGLLSSFILVLTIVKQVHKQWKEGRTEGVSQWLFAGQLAASTGFLIYSWLLDNWIFMFTNSVMMLSTLAGVVIFHHQRKRQPA